MSAIRELTAVLIAGGMDPADAAVLVANAVIEGSAKKRSAGAERTARYRDRKASQSVTERDGVTDELERDESVTTVTKRHIVTGTNTNNKKDSRRKRTASRTSLPSDFTLDPAMTGFAVGRGFDPPRIAREFEKFCNYHRSKGSLFADWAAAWRTWVNNGIEYSKAAGGGQAGFQWLGGVEGII